MKKIMFCGGGSAGHVIPNIAIIEQLAGKYEISYIGTNGIEKDICAGYNLNFYEFDGVKLVRGKILCNLKIPFKLHKSIAQCRAILKKVQPDLLFCKGGYASVPPALAASKLKINVLTHESDMTLGLANSIISRKCLKVLTSFPSTAKNLKNGTYTGTPMRKELFGKNKLFAKSYFDFDMRPTIIVLGGGSGSEVINKCIRQITADVCKNYNILHVCGKGNLAFSNIHGYRQYEFISDMGLAYACADYAISRCGANCAAELTALKIPTLFIPLENGRTRGDQVANADYYLKQGICKVLRENELNVKSLKDALYDLIADDKIKAALNVYNPECGNENIIYEIERALSK
jgi:UDP-N-acetylglucosamine--N-acetylmuramyl-(pentapeptide) pyrophosphoryl-undecaprenol N-acetylglucosamine transferase